MDSIDIKLLDLMQKNANLTVQELAKEVNLSTTPCWKRVRQLQKFGFINKTVSIINRKNVDLDVTSIVFVKIDNHNTNKINTFAEVVKNLPEVLECYRMSGEIDYLMKIVVKDISSYDKFYNKLIKKMDFLKVTSQFAIEEIKYTTELPLYNKDF